MLVLRSEHLVAV